MIKIRDFIDAGRSKVSARKVVRELDDVLLTAIIDNLISAQKSERSKREARAAREKAASIKQVKALMSELNLTADDISKPGKRKTKNSDGRRRGRKVAPKYAIKIGKEKKTWSGRGRMPLVFKNHIESGKSLDSCLIKKPK